MPAGWTTHLYALLALRTFPSLTMKADFRSTVKARESGMT